MNKKSIFIFILLVISVLVSYQLLRDNQYFFHSPIKHGSQSNTEKPRTQNNSNTEVRNSNYSFNTLTYGQSRMSSPLLAYKFTNQSPSRKILCVFAIHGFEDAFYKDGQALVDTANGVIEYFKNNPSTLNGNELIIVPCANPDGLMQGYTCNGPGRCQISQGIDMNMDFDYHFRPRVNARNKTGAEPFTSLEAAALRDLVFSEKPDIIIDFHGWVNCAAGDPEIAKLFCKHLGLTYEETDQAIYDGFFSGWASKYARTVLVEYPSPFTGKGSFDGKSDEKYEYANHGFGDFGFTENTVMAIRDISKIP